MIISIYLTNNLETQLNFVLQTNKSMNELINFKYPKLYFANIIHRTIDYFFITM